MSDTLKPGLTGDAEIVVGTNDTAPRIGSGRIGVMGTPVMINLMEAAALAAVEHLLDEGQQSLGTHLDVSHVAATPIGQKATAEAELVEIDGRTLTFAVRAHDEDGLIGEGRHKRVVVDAARFESKLATRAKR
ncbi:MAG TPA: thioesterase family protein [Thermohalobaculum sp.]|nr:thioesterase family protein [Thermohalobaculum sp.]